MSDELPPTLYFITKACKRGRLVFDSSRTGTDSIGKLLSNYDESLFSRGDGALFVFESNCPTIAGHPLVVAGYTTKFHDPYFHDISRDVNKAQGISDDDAFIASSGHPGKIFCWTPKCFFAFNRDKDNILWGGDKGAKSLRMYCTKYEYYFDASPCGS